MLNLDPWYQFIKDYIVKGNSVIEAKDDDEIRFASINTICMFLTNLTKDVLGRYCKYANIPDDYAYKINMKNEFLFSRLILTDKKKRYISSVSLREGTQIYPEKVDIKGHDFRKSSTREATEKFFTKLVKDKMLSGEIHVPSILKEISSFQKVVETSIRASKKEFLIPKKVNELASYKEPFGQQQVKAYVVWNIAEPDNSIQLPAKIDIVKLRMVTRDDLDIIKDEFPDVYKRLIKGIFDQPDMIKAVAKKGIAAIAIPTNLDVLPEWVRYFVDYDAIVNDNISRFYSALKALKIDLVRTSGRDNYSNILDM